MKRVAIAAAIMICSLATAGVVRHRSPAPPRLLKSWKLAFVRDGSIWMANGDGSGQRGNSGDTRLNY